MLTEELENLGFGIKEKVTEADEWKYRYSKMELNSRDVSSLENELHRLKDLLELKLHENDDLRYKLSQIEIFISDKNNLENKLNDQEYKNEKMLSEIDRLNSILTKTLSELEDWRSRCTFLESETQDREYLENELRKVLFYFKIEI